ncbi:MAG: radical SAM protein [Defluviitaleaceae bacterium]|nr:radical SAM protein [Defluviitaleaceae bacterium]
MENKLQLRGVWEITMGCNMRCKHCGSACKDKLDGELTTEEALNLCKQLAEAGTTSITLSGGEPTIRSDWHIIAKELTKNNVTVGMISNGWLVSEEIADRAFEAGINNFAISLDGLRDTHDYMRHDKSFDQIMNALDILRKKGVKTSIITTVNKRNIFELHEIKNILIEKGVAAWQIQFALPMGSFHFNRNELMIEQSQVDNIIDFAYEIKNEINVYLGNCIGYFTNKEAEIRSRYSKTMSKSWKGCPIGRNSFGVLHNGDILGCVSVRGEEFIEGNIRELDFKTIWDNGFSYNREMSKDKLSGFCGECAYGEYCLGGCLNTRYCTQKSMYDENLYCSYRNSVYKELENSPKMTKGTDVIKKYINSCLENESYNVITKYLTDYLKTAFYISEKDKIDFLNILHFAYYKMFDFEKSKEVCNNVLDIYENNSYALHGLAINLFELGEIEKSIEITNKLIEINGENLQEHLKDMQSLFERDGISYSFKIKA